MPPKTQVMGGYVGKKTASVVIKRQTAQTSGYQLRYATNSKLKNAKTITVKGNKNNTVSLNGLKAGTTYYMQARTYMAIKGKKYYSKWSSTEHCKTSGKSKENTSNTTPAPKPVPKLTLEEGKANITWKAEGIMRLKFQMESKTLIFLIRLLYIPQMKLKAETATYLRRLSLGNA